MEQLVGQLNREWNLMRDRIEELEKFQGTFTDSTLPLIHKNVADVTELSRGEVFHRVWMLDAAIDLLHLVDPRLWRHVRTVRP